MFLQHITLKNFRCYEEAEVNLPEGCIGLQGSNGQGKTNFLEAVHMITQGWSFRTRKDREMLRWEEEEMTIRASGLLKNRSHSRALLLRRDGSKRCKMDGQEGSGFSDLLGMFSCISIGPDDIDLVSGPPAGRRSFLDGLLCQDKRKNLDILRNFQRRLRQRNAFLASGSPDETLLQTLSVQLAESSAQVVKKRLDLVDFLRERAIGIYGKLANDQEQLAMDYRVYALENSAPTADDYLRFFEENRQRERDQKRTLAGAHLDELMLKLKDKKLRDFGSRGQSRSAALALRLASAAQLKDSRGTHPILLLDDIFAELDTFRRKALGELVSQKGQVFLAAPRLNELPFFMDRIFNVNEGKLEPES